MLLNAFFSASVNFTPYLSPILSNVGIRSFSSNPNKNLPSPSILMIIMFSAAIFWFETDVGVTTGTTSGSLKLDVKIKKVNKSQAMSDIAVKSIEGPLLFGFTLAIFSVLLINILNCLLFDFVLILSF